MAKIDRFFHRSIYSRIVIKYEQNDYQPNTGYQPNQGQQRIGTWFSGKYSPF